MPLLDMSSMRLGAHPIVFRSDFNTSRQPFFRFLKELPLVLVFLIFGWAQYTLAFSLVLSYLMVHRQHYKMGVLILVPFEFCWMMAIGSLIACVKAGPGWVQTMDERTFQIVGLMENAQSSSCDIPQGIFPEDDGQEPVPMDVMPSRAPRRFPHPYVNARSHKHYSEVDQESDDEDDYPGNADPEVEGATPLLDSPQPSSSKSNTIHDSRPRPHLPPKSPRPSSTALLPGYPSRPQYLPPSTLTFQEQVSLAEQRSSNRFDLVSALDTVISSSAPAPPKDLAGVDTLMCKSDGSKRFCRKCDLVKADRAHHCSSCKRCVLRMDHHCPWLGGRCVGLHNHKYFVLFLVWTSITSIICGFAALQGLSEFVTINSHLSEDQFRLAPLNWAFLFLVGILFGLVLTGFGAYHIYLVSVNRTTIENMERSLRVRPTISSDSVNSYALLRTSSRPLSSNDSPSFPNKPSDSTSQGALPSYSLPVYKSDDRLSRSERKKLELGATKLNVYDLGTRLANFKEIFGHHSRWWEWPLPIPPKG
ncbi:DHHC palmitoyltransferase-domain-containing protein [Melampsora americana]|nr:DHHC palmitoyltransferase-domain-containing protein [Melampsora americana]